MLILGIGDHVSCGSALVEDGKIKAAITDERLVREKMVFGVPRESIRAHMEIYGLAPGDIDAVAIGTRNQHIFDGYVDFRDGWFGLQRGKFKQALFDVASGVSGLRHQIPFAEKLYYAFREPAFRKRRRRLEEILRKEFGLQCPIDFVDHHFCHITSAYYTSGYRSATVFSVDGGGDGKSGSVYNVIDGQFKQLVEIPSIDSLGNFYSYITQVCGFKGGKHEGKITGMAAYGEPEFLPLLRDLMTCEDGTFRNVGNIFFRSALKRLRQILPDDFSHSNLAASVQALAEEMVVDLVQYWLIKTGQNNVAMAGGVTANVKINQRVHEIPELESIFIHPGMSDEGIPVGAALSMYYQLSGRKYDPEATETMRDVYLGPEYTDDMISEELKNNQLEGVYHNNIEEEVAKLLSSGAVVARFNGRMEYGPRSLGNRSILYQPTDPSVQYWMNDALQRTEFMPFAPMTLTESVDKCYTGMNGAQNTARFMTITVNCTPWMAENCPGVVHIDNTARPQLVNSRDNPGMYKILKEYERLTGLPSVINTSFNMHEEPIVCSPGDAIRAFMLGHLDYLAIGNWLVKNETPLNREVNSTRFDEGIKRRGFMSQI